jgi:hypothetical protein
VDWQNLRLSLASARRRAGPAWVLRALVEEVRRVLPDTGPEPGTVVWLFLSPASEQRADRALLEAAASADPSVTVQLRCRDGDLVPIELALRAADAWHEHPDATLAVVTDGGRFASVVRHYEQQPGRPPPWLLHVQERPPAGRGNPGGAGAGPPAVSRRLRPRLDRPAEVRGWTSWDHAAWALRRLAGRTDATLASRSLRPDPADGRGDPWDHADPRTAVGQPTLERLDNLVADLWRLEWGAPLGRDRAEAEAARRLAAGAAAAAAALDALLVAQLLRWHDAERLEVPPGWREGLLLPMRRVVLRLASQPDLTQPLARLQQLHRRRFLSRPAPPGAAPPGRVEHESREESWRRVRWALLEQLGAVRELPGWTAGGASWTLLGVPFAAATVETAERIRARLAGGAVAGQVEAELERRDVVRPSRWLRCLRDVGLVVRRGDRWGWAAGGNLHLP